MGIKDSVAKSYQELERETFSNQIKSLQNNALEKLNALGFPTQKSESWKYTSFQEVFEKHYSIVPRPHGDAFQPPFNDPDGLLLYISNGIYHDSKPSHHFVHNLKKYFQNSHSGLVAKYHAYNHDGFTYANDMLTGNGVLLDIDKNEKIETNIYIVHHVAAPDTAALCMPKVIINLQNGAHIKVTELFIGHAKDCYLYNTITEINLARNSSIKYHKIVAQPGNSYHVGTTQVNQLENSIFESVALNMSGKIIRNNLNIRLEEPRAQAFLYGFSLSGSEQTIDNHTVVDHIAPQCESLELYKSISFERGINVFNGKIFVRTDAQKTNAYQNSKNIIIGDHAAAYSKPQLEIWADDVKCSHGSTTGQLDKEALFYLKSRGIGHDLAMSMLISAYATDVMGKIENLPLRGYAESMIADKLMF